MPRKKKEVIEKIEKIENVEITSTEINLTPQIDLNFKTIQFKAGESYNFSQEAFEELKKAHPNLKIFIERGAVKIG